MQGYVARASQSRIKKLMEQLVGTKELILESDVKISDKKHQIIAALVWWCVLCAKSFEPCLILCDPMDCSPSGSPVHGILQQEYWSGSPCPPPGGPPDPGIKTMSLMSPALAAGSLPLAPPGKPPRQFTYWQISSQRQSFWIVRKTLDFRPHSALTFLRTPNSLECI